MIKPLKPQRVILILRDMQHQIGLVKTGSPQLSVQIELLSPLIYKITQHTSLSLALARLSASHSRFTAALEHLLWLLKHNHYIVSNYTNIYTATVCPSTELLYRSRVSQRRRTANSEKHATLTNYHLLNSKRRRSTAEG